MCIRDRYGDVSWSSMGSGVRVSLAFLVCLQGCTAWGTDGHQIIADVAAALLSPAALNTSQKVAQGSLASIANWADQVHHENTWAWSAPLHFLNVNSDCPVGSTCEYVRSRDCRDHRSPDFPFCVPAAVQNFTKQIHPAQSALQSEYAVRFLVHFMGDLHQPLHCALASDRGGNTIKVTFDVPGQGSSWDLHQVWDFGIIVRYINQSCAGDQKTFTSKLLDGLTAVQRKTYVQPCEPNTALGLTCPDTWAQGTFNQAMLHAYIDTATGSKVASGTCLLYTSPSPRDRTRSRMPSSA
eukprot:TRINITY_DN2209_c0_g1_i1.p1 TRINITY_DN2209_c0_g1~~TRINITY_DN2209_c0_g1_i1.p1  ORF type:complete len:296 (+),score=62.78 TRINITY_DN2209_c0_g1_i1:101-988(+)